MRETIRATSGLVVLLISLPIFAAAEKHTPGSDTTFSWKMMGLNESRDTGKPILLYIYDTRSPNDIAKTFETKVFPSPDVKTAFSEFLPVKISISDKSWPPGIVQMAKNGAAMLVMTCDARPLAIFKTGKMPQAIRTDGTTETYPSLAALADATAKMNPKALEKMQKNPPPKYVVPGSEPVAAAKEEPQDDKPKGVNALLGGDQDRGARDGQRGNCKKEKEADAKNAAQREAAQKEEEARLKREEAERKRQAAANETE